MNRLAKTARGMAAAVPEPTMETTVETAAAAAGGAAAEELLDCVVVGGGFLGEFKLTPRAHPPAFRRLVRVLVCPLVLRLACSQRDDGQPLHSQCESG